MSSTTTSGLSSTTLGGTTTWVSGTTTGWATAQRARSGPANLLDVLFAHDHVALLLRWDNLFLVLLLVGVLFSAKMLYSLPFLARRYLARHDYGNLSESLGQEIDGIMALRAQGLSRLNNKATLTARDSDAVAVAFSGYYIGIALVLLGVYQDFDDDPLLSILYVVFYITVGVSMMMLCQVLHDVVVLWRYNNFGDMAASGSVAVAVVEACGYVGAGAIVGASVSGPSFGWAEDIGSAILFFALGELTLLLHAAGYSWTVGYDDAIVIGRDGNSAAGTCLGLHLVAVGALVAAPIYASDSLVVFFAWCILGSFALIGCRVVVVWAIFGGRSLDKEVSEDDNYGAALIQGTVSLCTVFILNTFVWNRVCGGVR